MGFWPLGMAKSPPMAHGDGSATPEWSATPLIFSVYFFIFFIF
jgi:hypothetical protein